MSPDSTPLVPCTDEAGGARTRAAETGGEQASLGAPATCAGLLERMLSSLSPSTRLLAAAVLVGAITIAARIVPALAIGNHGADFFNYREMATATLRGDDIYAVHPLFPYMPYSQAIPASCLALAEHTGVPFQVLLKLVNIAGDSILAIAILLALWRSRGARSSLAWALALALNPVSILVSAFHGNLMALVPVFVGLAMIAGDRAQHARAGSRSALIATAALLLGTAIALRSFPLLLLPAFALWLAPSPRQLTRFAVLALAPSAFSALPYLLWAAPDFLQEVLTYSGVPDIGWLAALRNVPLLFLDLKLFEFGLGLLGLSKLLFLLAYAVSLLVIPFAGPAGRRQAVLLPPLLFFGLYGGVAAQYLVWIIPVAILTRDRWLVWFSGLGTVVMLAHYATYHPAILSVSSPTEPMESRLTSLVLVLGNAALAAFCCAWATRIVREESHALPVPARRAVWIGAAVVTAFFVVLLAQGIQETRRSLSLPVVELPARTTR